MRKQKLYFRFYSVLKNEDAEPYSDAQLLVAADGLGGAGSTVHEIDRAAHRDMRADLYRSAYGDFKLDKGDRFCDYLEKCLEPMADESDDTSALWASRIVIGRFVYALRRSEKFKNCDLSNETTREELVDYCLQGLERVADDFGLKGGKYANQLLLPTTLAAIRYKEEEDKVIAESVWAGDSRCYALTKEGLFALSTDDEDGSGAINNLFYLGEEKATLRYRRFEIAKPCVLMTVSDGIFDPFDPHSHLGVEKTLLGMIRKCSSKDELQESLVKYYDAVHGDDSTMAFTAFGFDDYAALQAEFSARTEYLDQVWNRFSETQTKMDVGAQDEDEVASYVKTRTADKFGAIIPVLLQSLKEGEGDFAAPTALREIVCGEKETEEETSGEVSLTDEEASEEVPDNEAPKAEEALEAEEILTAIPVKSEELGDVTVVCEAEPLTEDVREDIECARIVAALEALSEAMKADPKRVEDGEFFETLPVENYPMQIYAAIKQVKDRAKKLYDLNERLSSYQDKYGELMLMKNEYLAAIKEKIELNRGRFDELRGTDLYEEREKCNLYAYYWGISELELLKEERELTVRSDLPKGEEEFVKEINVNYIEKKKKLAPDLATTKANLNNQSELYSNRLETLVELLKADDPKICAVYFKKEIVEEFALAYGMGSKTAETKGEPSQSKEEGEAVETVSEEKEKAAEPAKTKEVDPMILIEERKEEIVAGIVTALAENYDKNSAIDVYYNGTRLSNFREYYRLKNNPDPSIKEFEKELAALENAYVSLTS